MHKALHPRDHVDRVHGPRKEEGRGLTSIQNSVDASIQRFEVYIKEDCDQKHYRQHKHQQKKNIQKTKMRRDTTLWTFQVTNSHIKKLGHGYEKETKRKKLNLF